jgi:hypothetical protein
VHPLLVRAQTLVRFKIHTCAPFTRPSPDIGAIQNTHMCTLYMSVPRQWRDSKYTHVHPIHVCAQTLARFKVHTCAPFTCPCLNIGTIQSTHMCTLYMSLRAQILARFKIQTCAPYTCPCPDIGAIQSAHLCTLYMSVPKHGHDSKYTHVHSLHVSTCPDIGTIQSTHTWTLSMPMPRRQRDFSTHMCTFGTHTGHGNNYLKLSHASFQA